jgi:antitoxin component YwqK of YwqJK toxin-antitoxin module
MKNIILLLTLTLFTNLIIAQEKKEYYDNGQLRSIKNYVDTIEHGSFIYYYDNGTLSEKGTMKNGELEGEYWSYNKEEILEEYYTYKNGYKVGPFKAFWETGELKVEGTYRKNTVRYDEPYRIGVYKAYLPNGEIGISAKFGIDEDNEEILIGKGMNNDYYETDNPYNYKLKEEVNLLDGEYHGVSKEYYENGQLKAKGEFIKGEEVGKHKEYYNNGQLKSNTTFLDGNKIGLYEEYLENGSPSKKGNNGEKGGGFGPYYGEIGNWTYWKYYSNGQLKKYYSKEEYIGFIGNYESYYENGKLKEKGAYKDDDKDGEWSFYYENGNLKEKGAYKDDDKNGEWSFYFSNGQLEKKYTEDNSGDYTGNYVAYYENGELRFKGEFVDDEKEGEWYQFEDGEKYKFLFENGELVKSKKVNSINDPIEDQFYKLNFKNKCNKKIELAIIFKNLDDEWENIGYYFVEPNKEKYLANTENRIYYYYAQTIGGKTTWTGDFKDTIHGNQHDFRKKTIPSDKAYGDQYTNLTFD